MWIKSSWRAAELHVAAESCSSSVSIGRLHASTWTSKPKVFFLYLSSSFSSNVLWGLGAGDGEASGDGDGCALVRCIVARALAAFA